MSTVRCLMIPNALQLQVLAVRRYCSAAATEVLPSHAKVTEMLAIPCKKGDTEDCS